MKRFPFRPRLLVTVSLVALLLPGCASKPNNLKPSMPEPRLGVASENPGKPKKGKQASSGSQYDTLWERMFSLYALPQVEHRSVEREVSWFINHPDYLKRAQKRAEPFLYTIVRQLEKQKMPGELALLPIVESAFQPHAVSPARAAGIWQFIPETGRRYGLKRSRSYDGRRDVYASTRAAIKYLKKLHNDFNGDWLLAIAAYNCGEGAVAKAIQRNEARNLPTDFWSLDLPDETKAYVPRLLAVSKVFANADKYAIDLHYIPNEAIFKPVKVSSQLDLALAADAADMSLERMLELNPGFKHPHADIEGSYRLFVPADKSRKFKKELARLAMSGQFDSRPPADEGDGSTGFGHRGSLETATEDDAAPGRERSVRKPVVSGYGAEYAVPSRSAERGGPAKDSSRSERWQSVETPSRGGSAVVAHLRDGSRLRDVWGREHGQEDKSLKGNRRPDERLGLSSKANPNRKEGGRKVAGGSALSREEALREERGDRGKEKHAISIPFDERHGGGIKASQSIRHTVKPGETLFAISQRFGVSVADLRKWNGVKENKLEAGRNIRVSAGKD
ncbi:MULTISPECIES: lytic transglycosylase [Methylococcus]|uniref:lytic transglycosylase n=1 Tax=Methylococcus TaxID=413 RepID=UPI001C530449|nr:LysM peptidoglycan-binding domain-containing protein [Methylococcus capsulatus]QXP87349.1 transglycosylase SLT domain-containing protein [Methylococcus capsulatus]QXP92910.1 transglycosylase SLT domain-containing protein [Methylococcus capsulatus]UQN12350.1 transglycosylase SLT domain-containing protein [Methylococcus capsulatus]